MIRPLDVLYLLAAVIGLVVGTGLQELVAVPVLAAVVGRAMARPRRAG